MYLCQILIILASRIRVNDDNPDPGSKSDKIMGNSHKNRQKSKEYYIFEKRHFTYFYGSLLVGWREEVAAAEGEPGRPTAPHPEPQTPPRRLQRRCQSSKEVYSQGTLQPIITIFGGLVSSFDHACIYWLGRIFNRLFLPLLFFLNWCFFPKYSENFLFSPFFSFSSIFLLFSWWIIIFFSELPKTLYHFI